jgi:hypothetical protein
MGRGYIWPKVKAKNYGFGERKLIFQPLGPLDVLPVQIPHRLTMCRMPTWLRCTSTCRSRRRTADSPCSSRNSNPSAGAVTTLASRLAGWTTAEKFRYGDQNRNWGNLYCEIRYTFIRDIRINTTGHEMPMGDPGTSWFYKVPSVGQDILGGVRNGQPFMRKAIAEDCRIYPFLR